MNKDFFQYIKLKCGILGKSAAAERNGQSVTFVSWRQMQYAPLLLDIVRRQPAE